MRLLVYSTASLLTALSLASCAAKRTYPLTDKKLKPTPAGQDVGLYVNELERPLVELALIDSSSYPDRESETVKKQLTELTNKARKMGADAVMNVEVLEERVSGVVLDEAVPFRSYRQGDYKLYYIRGTAVKYFETNEEALAFAGDDSRFAEKLKTQQKKSGDGPRYTRDRESEQPMDSIPRGLGRKNI